MRTAETPIPNKEIAERLGIGVETVRSTYKVAAKKMGKTPNKPTTIDRRSTRYEADHPEETAAFMDAITDPGLRSIAKAGRDAELPDKVIKNLLHRLQTDYQPVQRELARVKTDNLVREFENLGMRALQSITTKDIEDASAYQRTVMAAIAMDKRELLDGRPTERISHEDRRKLPELIKELMDEAYRRGYQRITNPDTGRASLMLDENLGAEFRTHKARRTVEALQPTLEVEQP